MDTYIAILYFDLLVNHLVLYSNTRTFPTLIVIVIFDKEPSMLNILLILVLPRHRLAFIV
jgi:hypothetical protein